MSGECNQSTRTTFQACVDTSCGSTSLALFEPDNRLNVEGLSMGDAAVKLKADKTLTLLESCQPNYQEAFGNLKQLLTTAPILCYPDFEKEFHLETDASGVGLGALLVQTQRDGSVRPIAYASRTLQPHEKNYGITELEALGVVWCRRYNDGHRDKV